MKTALVLLFALASGCASTGTTSDHRTAARAHRDAGFALAAVGGASIAAGVSTGIAMSASRGIEDPNAVFAATVGLTFAGVGFCGAGGFFAAGGIADLEAAVE